ncbi:hypothetical protein SGPA1_22060 [Streptomyces misionensis JCM 4497]
MVAIAGSFGGDSADVSAGVPADVSDATDRAPLGRSRQPPDRWYSLLYFTAKWACP